MNASRRTVIYIVGALNLLLVFLAAFSGMLELPSWLKFAGRLHPLLLHFPLALLIVLIIIMLIRPSVKERYESLINILVGTAAFTAVLSALFGLFLSREDGYEAGLITRHLWLGVSTSLLAFIAWLTLHNHFWNRIVSILTLPVVVLGSHYGAAITHGEDYLSMPSSEPQEKRIVVTDSSRIFEALIEPILASKCYSCHNEKKAKGELIMTSLAALLKGGKNGPLWVSGDPVNSHMIQRMELPEDDKKHMPPRGKAQLSDKEILLFREWIRYGADTAKRFMDHAATDSFRIFLQAYIPKQSGPTYDFPAADPDLIAKARSPFCDITPIAIGSPALAVRFAIRSGFNAGMLNALEKLSTQIVSINLSQMPVTDEDLKRFAQFTNLETLILNGSSIKGPGLTYLKDLPRLQSLSISGTQVSKTHLAVLTASPGLRVVHCWNTSVSSKDSAELKQSNASIHWDLGTKPDPNELVRLTPPQLVDLETPVISKGGTIVMKHPMPGVQIRYTLDGSKPDSLSSPLYNAPVTLNRWAIMKAIATRTGWLTSDTVEKTIFIRSAKPDHATLRTQPDTNYKANGILSLLDGKKGDMNNIREDWLAYHGKVCEAFFSFASPQQFQEVVVSTLKKTGPHVLPPERIELWAGNDSTHLKKIDTQFPLQPKRYEADKIDPQVLKSNGAYRYYLLKIFPVKALPAWHDSKGKKVWIFVDEVFFN